LGVIYCFLGLLSTCIPLVSPQDEKFLFVQSRKFRFAKAWQNHKRS